MTVAPIEAQLAAATPSAIGTVTHGFLDRIATEGLALWGEARIRGARARIEFALRADGVPEDELAGAAEAVERALLRTVADPRGRWILSPHAEARNEFEVAAVIGNAVAHLQIDRTFIDEQWDTLGDRLQDRQSG